VLQVRFGSSTSEVAEGSMRVRKVNLAAIDLRTSCMVPYRKVAGGPATLPQVA
jgi:hypothetical protein